MSNTIAVVGAGAWGQHHVRTFARLGALGAICDPRSEQLERYRREYPGVELVSSFQRILDDPSITAVVIATPAETHFSMASKAIHAGKDVLVEKPMALRRDEGEALLGLAERHQRILMVGHLLQYHPAVLQMKRMVDEGLLGKVQYLYSNRLNIGKIRSEENILWSFAPHDISVTLMLLGESPVSVSAHGGSYLHHQRPDVTMTTLTFASGVKGHIFVSWLHPHKEQRFVVVGDRGMLVFDDLEPTDKLRLYAHQVDWIGRQPVARKAKPTPVPVDLQEPLQLECEHFLACIADRRTPRTDAREGLAVLSVLEACQQSLDQDGTAVTLSRAPVTATPAFVHSSAFVDAGCEIGEGTKIWHFSHVLAGSTIGRNCSLGQNVMVGPNVHIGDRVKIQNNVSIYQGVTLEDEVFCGPSMVFTNVTNPRSAIARMHELRPTLVQRGASIGANATIVCGHTVGAYSFVGAGAVVTKDIPEMALVVGNPARVIGWMCKCGVRLRFADDTATCIACGNIYRKAAGRVRQIAPPDTAEMK